MLGRTRFAEDHVVFYPLFSPPGRGCAGHQVAGFQYILPHVVAIYIYIMGIF